MKRLQTSNCCKKKRTQADDTSQNTLSEKCISLHNEGAFDQFCSEDAFPVRLISLVMGSSFLRLSVVLIGFSQYPPILLSLDLYSQNSWPSFQELPGVVLRSGLSSQMQAGSLYFPGFQCFTFELTSLLLFLGSETALEIAVCMCEDHGGNGMAEYT